ncbi:MAG: sec-independent protein translocase protein TatC [Chloroflexota bacterium]|jgi:sec-independent protein translocase protein TatC|nr:sec-independent protein translocase protein TatC [Chloroflexota bacterium]
MSEPPVFVAPAPLASVAADDVADDWDQSRMTLIEHLEELRKVLIISLIAWAVTSIIGIAASAWVIEQLVRPLRYLATTNPDAAKLHYFGLFGYFGIRLKVGLAVGLAIALPVILQQFWSFISPGLRPQERRFARPLLISSLTLFALGAALAYVFLFIAVRFLAPFVSGPDLVLFTGADEYLGFVVILMLAFAVTFEFPVALVLLASAGLVSSASLRKKRLAAIFIIIAVALIVTPGVDPVTPMALAVPLVLLYEGSIQVIRRMGK